MPLHCISYDRNNDYNHLDFFPLPTSPLPFPLPLPFFCLPSFLLGADTPAFETERYHLPHSFPSNSRAFVNPSWSVNVMNAIPLEPPSGHRGRRRDWIAPHAANSFRTSPSFV